MKSEYIEKKEYSVSRVVGRVLGCGELECEV